MVAQHKFRCFGWMIIVVLLSATGVFAQTETPTPTQTPTNTLSYPTFASTFTPKNTKTPTNTPTSTRTRRPTNTTVPTSTPVDTPTVTPTVNTPTPTFGPLVDQDQVNNASLVGVAYPTPGICGTPVPCQSDYITATCTSGGEGIGIQLQGIPHTGIWAGTPIPINTPFGCPGWTGTDANFSQCRLCVTTPGATPGAPVSGWIDRRRKAAIQP